MLARGGILTRLRDTVTNTKPIEKCWAALFDIWRGAGFEYHLDLHTMGHHLTCVSPQQPPLSEKGARLAQKLGQFQPFMAVFLQGCIGQLASFGPT